MQIYPAEPYRPGAMGSCGDARYMLLAQHQFPVNEYHDTLDILIQADHDRCLNWDWAHATHAIKKHTGSGEIHIGQWCRASAPEDVIAFLKDILKADKYHPGVKWTGYRILGTVNLSNGFSVFTLQLFARKSPQTKVCDGIVQAPPDMLTPAMYE